MTAGRVVVVTGAGHGIGADIAVRAAARGARVVCAAGAPGDTVARIRATGGEAVAVSVEGSDATQCARVVDVARAVYGPVDALVVDAAVGRSRPASWRAMCRAFVLSTLVLDDMLRRGDGRIVTITSQAGTHTAAVERFTRDLAREVHGRGVEVSTVALSRPADTAARVAEVLFTRRETVYDMARPA